MMMTMDFYDAQFYNEEQPPEEDSQESETSTRPECGFPYVHRAHKYPAYETQRMIDHAVKVLGLSEEEVLGRLVALGYRALMVEGNRK